MKKKTAKGSRAVSPVLATLLMIAVAVSMSVILFMWSQGFLATTSEAASSQQSAQNVAAQSSITIESVQFADDVNTNNKGMRIIVRNVGTAKVVIGGLYVNNTAMTLIPDEDDETQLDANNKAIWIAYDKNHNAQGNADGSLSSGEEVPPQGYAKVVVRYSWNAGNNYTIKVTTTVGTFAETVVTAPA